MRVLVLSTIWPHPSHGLQAANIILFELLIGLSKHCHVAMLKIEQGSPKSLNAKEARGAAMLKEGGIDVLPPVGVDVVRRPRSVAEYFYPACRARASFQAAISPEGFDSLLVPLSEFATMLAADIELKKFAYYGNPDSKVRRARAEINQIYGGRKSPASALKSAVGDRIFESAHVAEMNKFDLLGNVANNDAEYYAAAGHPRSFYVRNMWIQRTRPDQRETSENATVIVANIGRLSSTANSLGLTYLANKVLPLLTEQMKRPFTVRLFGSGDLFPELRRRLEGFPQVEIHGYVEDIDLELETSTLFLCVNNATTFKVCHTRYLHAWSLGLCVVAHADAALSIPEMRHRENALLGSTPQHLVNLIQEACDDRKLRESIGDGGRQTFVEQFTSSAVTPSLAQHLSALN